MKRAGLTTMANAGVSVARAGVSFLTVGLLVRYLGRQSYGLAMTVTGMAAWLSVAQGGICQSLRNEMIRQPEAAGSLLAGAFASMVAIVAGAGAGLTVAIAWLPWKAILNDQAFEQTRLVVFAVWIVLVSALLSLVRAAYSARQAEFKLAPGMLAGVLVSLGFVFTGVQREWGMTAVVCASLLATPIGLAAGLVLMPRLLGIRLEWPRRMHRGGLWFLTIDACTILIFEADLFLVNLLLGQTEAAGYALHLQLFAYVEAAAVLLVSPWWAAFGDAWNAGDRAWLRGSVARLAGATGIVSGCGVALVLAVGQPVMNLWGHGAIAWNPLLALAIGANVAIQSITGVYATALGSLGVARDPARIVMFQAGLNVCVCLWLIRRFGVAGAAMGSLCTYALTSGLYLPWKLRRALA